MPSACVGRGVGVASASSELRSSPSSPLRSRSASAFVWASRRSAALLAMAWRSRSASRSESRSPRSLDDDDALEQRHEVHVVVAVGHGEAGEVLAWQCVGVRGRGSRARRAVAEVPFPAGDRAADGRGRCAVEEDLQRRSAGLRREGHDVLRRRQLLLEQGRWHLGEDILDRRLGGPRVGGLRFACARGRPAGHASDEAPAVIPEARRRIGPIVEPGQQRGRGNIRGLLMLLVVACRRALADPVWTRIDGGTIDDVIGARGRIQIVIGSCADASFVAVDIRHDRADSFDAVAIPVEGIGGIEQPEKTTRIARALVAARWLDRPRQRIPGREVPAGIADADELVEIGLVERSQRRPGIVERAQPRIRSERADD